MCQKASFPSQFSDCVKVLGLHSIAFANRIESKGFSLFKPVLNAGIFLQDRLQFNLIVNM